MLLRLTIQNLVVIKKTVLNFHPGFNAITGETGSGKSVLLSSIALLLGQRAETKLIREGSESACIEGVFDISSNKEALKLLKERGLSEAEPDPEGRNLCIIRRVLSNNGSTLYINGFQANLKALKTIAPLLIEITSQHEFHFLSNSLRQLDLLDSFSGVENEISEYQIVFKLWSELKEKLDEIIEFLGEFRKKEDYIRFQIGEIEKANIHDENEYENNQEKLKAALRHEERTGTLRQVTIAIDQNEGLSSIIHRLSGLCQQSGLNKIQSGLDSIAENLGDLSYEANKLLHLPQFSDQDIQALRERQNLLDSLLYKFGPTVSDLTRNFKELESEIQIGEQKQSELTAFKSDFDNSQENLSHLANQLHEIRLKNKESFEKEVVKALKSLSMEGSRFGLDLKKTNSFKSNGVSSVQFLFNSMGGESLHPLQKVASGGELSRLLLAIKSAIKSGRYQKQSLLFDEVDSGIGGMVGRKVGEKLAGLSKNQQVILITHLPQVAGLADRQFLVERKNQNGVFSDIKAIESHLREDELARMMGIQSTDLDLQGKDLLQKNYLSN